MSNFDLINLNTAGLEVESERFISEHNRLSHDFVPDVDFSDPVNFAFYGLAEKYYIDSFEYIKNTYPYDGSLSERMKWHNDTSYFDRYVFDNIYPRTNGHIIFSYAGWGTRIGAKTAAGTGIPTIPEYIKFYGGPHAYSTGGYDFNKSNIYDSTKSRENNLQFGQGETVEFYLKKAAVSTLTDQEVVFDLWNGSAIGSASYSRLCIVLNTLTLDFNIEYYANGVGGTYTNIGTSFAFSADWVYWAFVFDPINALLTVYKATTRGPLVDVVIALTDPGSICERDISGYIGSFQGLSVLDGASVNGAGKLDASLDEFRFWKTVRNDKEIFRNHNVAFGGGTNTDEANTNLGVYFKFNEGITTASGYDANILDYSGRISNGTWYGYCGGRSEDSAIIDGGFATEEFEDPILYDAHPDYSSLYTQYETTGRLYDATNANSVWHMFPGWLREEDAEAELRTLAQIIGSYFDMIALQIKYLNDYKTVEYKDVLRGNNLFASRLLSGLGIEVGNIFDYTSILEEFFNRNDDVIYEEQLFKVRNLIYAHIYKNIINILKQKGTLNGVRNLIRCFGVDDDVARLKIYSDGKEFDLSEVKTYLNERKKRFVSFAHPDNHAGTIYGYSPMIMADERDYIAETGGAANCSRTPITIECDVIFPAREELPAFTKSSIFGMHQDNGVMQWDGIDNAMFQVYSERHPDREGAVRFILESTGLLAAPIVTDYYENVYNGSYWNFAVRVLHTTEDIYFAPVVADSYKLEFYGVQVEYASIKNYFEFTSSIVLTRALEFFRRPKRLYVGAHYQDWNDHIHDYSDVMIGNLRYYLDYIPNEMIDAHALNPINLGVTDPVRAGWFGQAFDGLYRPLYQMSSMVFNWGFDTNTTLTVSGIPTVYDIPLVYDLSGGSVAEEGRYETWINDIVPYRYPATGIGFQEPDPTEVFYTGRFSVDIPVLPDELAGYGLVESKEYYELEKFQKTIFPSRLLYVLEKSVYGIISNEMLRFLGSLENYGDLWGQGVDRYRIEYKRLNLAKHLFFDRVRNTVDVERFTNYYRWIDGAVGKFVGEFLSGTDRYLGGWDVIESHAFERNKYESKYPLMKNLREKNLIGSILSGELWYDWEFGHAPLAPDKLLKNGQWWKKRAERNNALITSGDAAIDADREDVKDEIERTNNADLQNFYDPISATTYQGRTYALRSFAGATRITVKKEKDIHGGINYHHSKNLFFGAHECAVDGVMTFITDGFVDLDCIDYDPLTLNKKRIYVDKFSGSNSLGAWAWGKDSQFMPGSFYIDNEDNVHLTNIHHNSYLPAGDEPIKNTAIDYGGWKYRKQLKCDQLYTVPDTTQNVFDEGYIFYLDVLDDNWVCDKVLSNKRMSGWIFEDIARPVNIQNIKG